MRIKVQTYEDAAGEYRWRIKAGNGRVIADSGEGYKERSKAKKMAERLLTSWHTITWEDK